MSCYYGSHYTRNIKGQCDYRAYYAVTLKVLRKNAPARSTDNPRAITGRAVLLLCRQHLVKIFDPYFFLFSFASFTFRLTPQCFDMINTEGMVNAEIMSMGMGK